MKLSRATGLVIAVVAVVVGLGAPMRATYGARTTADEPHYLLTAISLWDDHSLDVSDERTERRYTDFHETALPLQATIEADGSQVAPHDPLLPLLLAAPAGLGGWLGAKLALAVMAGVLAGLLFRLSVREGVRRRVAGIGAVLAGCSAPLAVYGTQVYPELPAALLTLAAYGWLTGPRRTRSTVLAAAAVVALPWLSVKYALVAAVLGVGVVLRFGSAGARRWLAVGGFAAMGVLFVVLHQRWYGGFTAYASGSHFQDGELTVVGNHPDYVGRTGRLVGLLVDRDFGLAAWQPAFLLAVPAAAGWVRRRRSWLLPAAVAAGWATATWVALTMNGWWWPGRQTVIIVPLLALAVISWADGLSAASRRLATALAGLGVATYLWLVVDVLRGRHRLIVDFERTSNVLVRVWRLALPDFRADDAANVLLATAWAVVLVAGALGAVATERGAAFDTDTDFERLRHESEEAGVTHEAVVRPFGDLDLGLQLGADPGR